MKASIAIASALVLAGCASSDLKLSPVGGSKAEGIVVMAVEAGFMGTPTFDVHDGNAQAAKACVTWGYAAAEMMPNYQYRCGSFTCETRVHYQCTQR